MLTYVSGIKNSHFAFTPDSLIYHAITGWHNMISCSWFLQNEIKVAWSSSCDLRRCGGLWLILQATEEKRACFTCRWCFAGEENGAGRSRRVYRSPLCQNADEIESKVSTETPVIAKCHVCIIIQNQCSFWGETYTLVSQQTHKQKWINNCDTLTGGRSDFSGFFGISKD